MRSIVEVATICSMVCLGFVPSLRAEEEVKAEKPAEDPIELNVGDRSPAFEGTDDSGKVWKSSDHVGENILVVYFFPAAMTGG